MRRTVLTLAAAAGILAAASPALAEPSAEDMRCIALFAIKGKAAAAQSMPFDVFLVGSYFYLGRIRAGDPDADLTAPMATAILELEGMSVELEQERCLGEVREQGGRLRAAFSGAQAEVDGG